MFPPDDTDSNMDRSLALNVAPLQYRYGGTVHAFIHGGTVVRAQIKIMSQRRKINKIDIGPIVINTLYRPWSTY